MGILVSRLEPATTQRLCTFRRCHRPAVTIEIVWVRDRPANRKRWREYDKRLGWCGVHAPRYARRRTCPTCDDRGTYYLPVYFGRGSGGGAVERKEYRACWRGCPPGGWAEYSNRSEAVIRKERGAGDDRGPGAGVLGPPDLATGQASARNGASTDTQDK